MPADAFHTFALEERERLTRHLRTSILVAALIAALMYLTQWIALRPGLAILFIGQAALIIALLLRLSKLKIELSSEALDQLNRSGWFEREQSFIKGAALFESICHAIGFALLGYAFWLSTTSLWFALAVGLLYPAIHVIGVTRQTTRKTLRRLRKAQQTLLSET